MMARGGRQVTCGMENQCSGYTGVKRSPSGTSGLTGDVMLRDLTSPENYFDTTGDPTDAASRHAAGLFPVIDDPAVFLGCNDTLADRFGKVTFLHA